MKIHTKSFPKLDRDWEVKSCGEVLGEAPPSPQSPIWIGELRW